MLRKKEKKSSYREGDHCFVKPGVLPIRQLVAGGRGGIGKRKKGGKKISKTNSTSQ